MSVIAARIEDNRIYVSSDSILVKDDLKSDYTKLIKLDDFIIGGCGDADELCLMLNFAETTAPQEATVTGVLEYLREFMDYKGSFLLDGVVNNAYVIACKGKLFLVEGLFVKEITTYTAIGAGERYALAALHLGHSTVEAVEVASELCCYVSNNIVTYSTCCS